MSAVAESLPIIFGEYALIERLGQGAAGEVFLARPVDERRAIPSPLVIKRLHEKHTSDEDLVRRFRHEAEVAVYMDSPFIAKVYEVGQIGASLYIAMEYVPGLALNHFLSALVAHGRYPPLGVVVQLASDALYALELFHNGRDRAGRALGLIHRDISPKNLMFGDDGMLRMIDLGFAKSEVQDWKTATGVVMGSLGYMPPEQLQGSGVDQRADLYAIGVVLYELLTVRRFIKIDSIAEMVRSTLSETRAPPSHVRADISPALDALILRATAKDRDSRFSSAREMNDALAKAHADRPTREQLALFLERAKDEKQREKTAEIAELLRKPLPLHAEESMKTTIYVERPAPEPPALDTLRLAVEATAILPSKKQLRIPTVALVMLALIVGIVAGMQLRSPEPAPVVIPAVPTVPREQPQPVVRASQVPEVIEEKLQDPVQEVAERPAKVVKTAPDLPATVPKIKSAPNAADLADKLNGSLNERLRALPADDPRAKKIEALLFDLTMVRSMKDPERAANELQRLSKAFEGLGAP
jgi:serine/threonine-protein kinase